MPYKDPEKRKAYDKARYEANKEKKKAYDKAYREANKEKRRAYKKAYNQTPAGKKTKRIGSWKDAGIIYPDLHGFYDDVFIKTTHCEDCGDEFIEHKRGESNAKCRCLDHDHQTGEIRGIVCNCCNLERQ